ncbi:MAG: LamG domain-containing protein [Bacteroidales bacterium]
MSDCKKIIGVFFLLWLSLSLAANGDIVPKRDKYVEELIMPTAYLTKDFEASLSEGYRCFIITASSDYSDSIVSILDTFLKNNPREFVAFIQQGAEHYKGDYIYSYFSDKIVEIESQPLSFCDSMLNQGKQILFFSEHQDEKSMQAEDFLSYATLGVNFPIDYSLIFNKFSPCNTFTCMEFSPSSNLSRVDTLVANQNLYDASINFLKRTGKIPNFILTDQPNLVSEINLAIDFLLKIVVEDEHGNRLEGVRFEGYGGLQSFGNVYFFTDTVSMYDVISQKGSYTIVPRKPGYSFMPGRYTFNFNNYSTRKLILAKRNDLKDQVYAYLPLTKKRLSSEAYPTDVSYSNIAFSKNSKHKGAALFNGLDNGVFFKEQRDKPLGNNFSFTMWIRPKKVDGNYSLMSKAGSYCLKIRDGKLCFTAVDIVDGKSDSSQMYENEWQHVSFVYEAGNEMKFFINGELKELKPAVDYHLLESGYMVGVNQWDEFFDGEITDLCIWSRPLNNDEVKEVFQKGVGFAESRTMPIWLLVSIILCVLSLTFLMFYFFLRKRRSVGRTFVISDEKAVVHANFVKCFGTFAIYDDQGVNLLDKLSEKKSSFLLYLIFHTLRDNGISPQELTDTFWPGYSPSRAKNVRGTYMQEIRAVVPTDILEIKYKSKSWRVVFKEALRCDLSDWLILEKRLSEGNEILVEEVLSFKDIVIQGLFAEGLSNEYVDNVKQDINDRTIEVLESLLESTSLDDSMKLELAGVILILDPVHESVLEQKVDILIRIDDKRLAHKCVQRFAKEWEQLYDEKYIPKEGSSLQALIQNR